MVRLTKPLGLATEDGMTVLAARARPALRRGVERTKEDTFLGLLVVALLLLASLCAAADEQEESTFWSELVDADVHTQYDGYPSNHTIAHPLSARHESFRHTGLTCMEKCTALVVVITNVERWAKRLVWRYTVGQHLPQGVDLVFPIISAKRVSDYQQRYLQYERMTLKDVLYVEPERVKRETHTARFAAAIQYLVEKGIHLKYDWLVKVDDDTIIQPQSLLTYFQHVPQHKVLACRSNAREHNYCGGPLVALRSSFAPRFLQEIESAGLDSLSWHDDVFASEVTERVAGNKTTTCFSPPHFVHEPQNKNTHWSMPVTNTTVAVHLLKPPHAFLAGFIRMFPQVSAWEACRMLNFQPAHCRTWQQAYAHVCDPDQTPKPQPQEASGR